MYKIRASNTPDVRLISPRTDGKTDKHSSPYEDLRYNKSVEPINYPSGNSSAHLKR